MLYSHGIYPVFTRGFKNRQGYRVYPGLYPAAVDGKITTACSRYPIAWKGGSPKYPVLTAVTDAMPATAANLSSLIVYPNPSTDKINVTYQSNKASKINLLVYDKTGRLILEKQGHAVVGINNYDISLYGLASGLYYVELNNDENIKIRQQFMVSK